MERAFLTPRQAGEAMGISGQTVRNLIRAGRIEAILVNISDSRPQYRIRASEVEKWLLEQTVGRRR